MTITIQPGTDPSRGVDYDIAEGVVLPDTPLALALVIDAATTKLATVGMGLASDAEVMAALQTVETARRRAAAVDSALLVEVSDRNLYRRAGHSSVRRFLAQDLRLGPTEAKRRYQTALLIGRFTSLTGQKLPPSSEPLAAGVADGEISADHLHEIDLLLAKVPSLAPNTDTDYAVDILATAARTMAPQDLRPLGQRLLAHLDPDGKLTDDTDRQRQRGLTLGRQDRQLMSKITGAITPALRAKFEVILHNWAAPGMNNPADEHPTYGSITNLDDTERDALAEAVKRDLRTPAQRNHDALDMLCEWILGHQALGRPNRIPSQLVITAELSQLTALATGQPIGAAPTTTGTPFPSPTSSNSPPTPPHGWRYLPIKPAKSSISAAANASPPSVNASRYSAATAAAPGPAAPSRSAAPRLITPRPTLPMAV